MDALSSLPSIGSPKTLNILPRVASPTGTSIGLCVLITSIPLLTPSVGAIATQRQTSSPTCCSTSNTKVDPLRSRVKAVKIGGK